MAADGRSSCSGLLLTALLAAMLLPGEFTAGTLNGCCRFCYRSLARVCDVQSAKGANQSQFKRTDVCKWLSTVINLLKFITKSQESKLMRAIVDRR